MLESTATLVSDTNTQNEVYVSVWDITQNEFNVASQSGIRARLMLKTSLYDYNNEEICEYDGNTYKIYRTYKSGDYIELYLAERVGVF